MLETQGSGYGGHQKSGSTSGAAIIAAFVPTFVSAVIYLAIFVAIRNKFQKHYAPRTFLGTVPEKNRTPASSSTGTGWFHDFRKLPSRFVLTHSSLDAYLYLRFLKFIIAICFLGSCLVLPVLITVNATAGVSPPWAAGILRTLRMNEYPSSPGMPMSEISTSGFSDCSKSTASAGVRAVSTTA